MIVTIFIDVWLNPCIHIPKFNFFFILSIQSEKKFYKMVHSALNLLNQCIIKHPNLILILIRMYTAKNQYISMRACFAFFKAKIFWCQTIFFCICREYTTLLFLSLSQVIFFAFLEKNVINAMCNTKTSLDFDGIIKLYSHIYLLLSTVYLKTIQSV